MLTASATAAASTCEQSRAAFAREQFTFLLQLACSGELAATRAYLGHRQSLHDSRERAELGKIIRDEVRHRHCLLDMLDDMRAAPIAERERKMNRVGRAIAVFCRVGGWFFPMYGAARLESQNIREYEIAARLALVAEADQFVGPLLEMAEVEWDHELYFRSKAASRFFWRLVPKWPRPPAREAIRGSFDEFARAPERPVHSVRAPWLVR